MPIDTPWGPLDPNSQHQLWSEWVFTVYEGSRAVPTSTVTLNALRWLRRGFGTVGQAKVDTRVLPSTPVAQRVHVIMAQVEGAPAHDPGYVASIRRQFCEHFVQRGWGPLATGTVTVRILAGDIQDGTPRAQLVVMSSTIGPTSIA